MPGFHEGELAVQRAAGVESDAARLIRMLAAPDLRGGAAHFLAAQSIAALTGRDADGRRWTTVLPGEPGFLEVRDASTLAVHALPAPGDPLHDLSPGQPVGLVVMDFARRRRLRVNGTLTTRTDAGLTVVADQAYGNCPQHIHPARPDVTLWRPTPPSRHSGLTADDERLIRGSEFFFLGTGHPYRGSDASHRGGPAGFVTVEGGNLSWPDFPGNNMFNSFGNLAVDPAAALALIDLADGRTVQVSGSAALHFTSPEVRRVDFTVEAVVSSTRSHT